MQTPIFRGSLSPCRIRCARRFGAAPVLFLLMAPEVFSGAVQAQVRAQVPVVPAPAQPTLAEPALNPVARPLPATNSLSVLIVALDDASEPVFAGEMPLLPAAPPSTFQPDVPLTAITPTRFDLLQPHLLQPQWRVLAKKVKKPDPRFFPFPEPPSKAPITSGGPSPYRDPSAPPISSPPINGTDASGSSTPAPLLPARPLAPPGRATLAALPLARALGERGYTNVQATSPDGSILARALGEKRLLPGTLSNLREALRSLQNASKLPAALRQTSIKVATNRATNAAAAIGQATGYRAVVALYVAPFADGVSPYAAVLCDSARESGEAMLWNESAPDEARARDTGAATGAALLDKSLAALPPAPASTVATLFASHLAKARAAGVAGDLATAQDEITRATTLDSSRAEAYILRGDLLSATDIPGATAAYKQAVALNFKDGATFEKIAIAYANAPVPDWPRALDAGQKALAAGTDTTNLRIAMARAQFGRGDLFRRANRVSKAEDAEVEAQVHLDRALQLSPDNPAALRLLARALLISGRTTEAVQTLGRVVPLFPQDIELQRQYAQALMALGDRKEDAFSAYAKLWRLSANSTPQVNDITYTSLIEGFDEHVFNLGKSARQLSDGVSTANIARESAFLQLARLKSDMSDAEATITALRVPIGFSATASTARQFAATLMSQALEAHQTFLDTGQDLYRTRAGELYRQAVAQLNTARNAM